MTSYISYKDKGFWINDSIMQFSLCYLYNHFSEKNILASNAEFYSNLKDNYLGYFSSYMHLNWETVLDISELEELKKGLLDLILELNTNKNISLIFLNEFSNFNELKEISHYLPNKSDKQILIDIYNKLSNNLSDLK